MIKPELAQDPKAYLTSKLPTETLEAIRAFWTDFTAAEQKILTFFEDEKSFDLLAFMSERLERIAPDIAFEFSRADQGLNVSFSSEQRDEIAVQTFAVVHLAPKLNNFRVYYLRSADRPEILKDLIEGRLQTPFQVKGWKIKESKGNLIDVEYFIEGKLLTRSQRFSQAVVALEILMGEAFVKARIGQIAEKNARGVLSRLIGRRDVPLDHQEVVAKLKATKERLLSTLPDKPHTNRYWNGSSRVLAIREAEEAEEYPFLDDLCIINIGREDVLQGLLMPGRFKSDRFSRFEESFCFIKMVAPEIREDSKLRGELEDKLSSALNADSAGGVFGSGTGFVYSYIFLAISDFEAAEKALKSVIGTESKIQHAWLMFLDFELHSWSAPLTAGSPPPPLQPTH